MENRRRCNHCLSSVKRAKTTYNATDHGKKKNAARKKNEAGVRARKKYAASDKRKETRYAHYEAHKDDPGRSLWNAIKAAASNLLSGRQEDSPNFVARTFFNSIEHFRDHMEANKPTGTTMAQYGSVWEIDHKIPQSQYDFTDPEDARRCWCPENLWGSKENKEKHMALIPKLCRSVPVAMWPAAWGGMCPV